MVFLLAVSAFQWIAIVQTTRAFLRMRSGEITGIEAALTSTGMISAAILIGAPLLMEFATVVAFDNGHGIAVDGGNRSPLWLLSTGSCIALAVFGYRLYKQRAQHRANFFAIGANVSSLVIALYIAVVVVDQFAFFGPLDKDAGMVNWGALKEMSDIQDMQCNSDLLIVKDAESETATYRCPQQVVMVFGRFSGRPIVPWPSYTEGTSHDLAVALRTIQASAINHGETEIETRQPE